MKIFKYEQMLLFCWNCPACSPDLNVTRWECGKKNRKFIMWMGPNEEIMVPPEWCPLEEVEASGDATAAVMKGED